MAPKGQMPTHAPQLMHFSGSIVWACFTAPEMAFVPVFHQYGMDTLPQFRTQPGQAFGDILMHQTLGKAKGSSSTAHRSAMVNNILPQH